MQLIVTMPSQHTGAMANARGIAPTLIFCKLQ